MIRRGACWTRWRRSLALLILAVSCLLLCVVKLESEEVYITFPAAANGPPAKLFRLRPWGPPAPPYLVRYAGKGTHRRVLLSVPGGSYARVSMEREGAMLAKEFTAMGFAFFVLSYTTPPTTYLTPSQEIEMVVQSMKAYPEFYDLHPSFSVGVMGFSAGGHAVGSYAVTTKQQLSFIVLNYPVISMQDGLAHRKSRENLLGSLANESALRSLYSLERRAKDFPKVPIYIWTTMDDQTVSPGNALEMSKALELVSADVRLQVYPDGGHTSWARNPNASSVRWRKDLRRWLDQKGLSAPGS